MRNVIRLVVLAVLVPALAGAGQIFTVGPGGTHATVQAAVNDAAAAGGDNEVRIVAGTIVGRVEVGSTLSSGSLEISGGWDAAFAAQAHEPGLTVLDGAGTGSTVYLNGPGAPVTLRNLTVTGGRSDEGGGVRISTSGGVSLTVSDCRITGNTAVSDSGGSGGGGLAARLGGSAILTATRLVVVGNAASSKNEFAIGGGVFLSAGSSSRITLEDSLIAGNSVESDSVLVIGAGIYAFTKGEGTLVVRRTTVARNSATPGGGQSGSGATFIAMDTSHLTLSGSALLDNVQNGSSTFVHLGLEAWDSGGVVASGSIVAGGSGHGVRSSRNGSASIAVDGCTVVENSGTGLRGNPTSTYNTVAFGNGENSMLGAEVATGGNLIGVDPLFVNAELCDYRLLPGSPAIDTGVEPPGGLSQTDFAGHPRKVGGQVDVGAHEYQGEAVSRAAALAHTTGFGGTPWRSDLDLANLSSKPADLTVVFENANGRTTRAVTLAAGETRAWTDVLTSLFGFGATARVTGSLKVLDPTGSVAAAVRTYADGGAAGTYGQGYPVLGEDAGIVTGTVGILPMVKSNTQFYSNVGVLALGQARAQVRVTLIGPSGATLGTPQTVGVDPGRWVQIDDVFAKAGAPSAGVAYATVEPLTEDARVWAAASVIDRTTKDPTTVEAAPALAAGTVHRVAAVTHGSGFGGIAWRSTVAVVNTGGSAANATLTFRGASTIVRTATVPANGVLEWPDVLVGLFGLGAEASASGALEVVADSPVVVACRTYADKGKDGTFGQSYPALVASQGVAAGEAATLPQLRKNAKAYTNIGALNLSTVACSATVQLHDAQGKAAGSERSISTQPGGWSQISDVFNVAGAGGADEAYAGIRVTTEGCRMWFYASVIDSITRDPTTIELARPFVVEPGR
ncbi:MAG: choice-of-anchor Q domain-containing protein [Thermoanaerobaculaceae bacterium]